MLFFGYNFKTLMKMSQLINMPKTQIIQFNKSNIKLEMLKFESQ